MQENGEPWNTIRQPSVCATRARRPDKLWFSAIYDSHRIPFRDYGHAESYHRGLRHRQNISEILVYALILASVVPFSATRYLSQGHRDATKTGIAVNLLISLPITAVFLLLTPRLVSVLWANILYFEAASVEISLLFILQILQGTVLALSPHLLGYGAIVYEFTRIALGIVLVPILGLGLTGAILAVVVSQARDIDTREIAYDSGCLWQP